MATHSSVLAWRIPGKGEPGGLPSMGLHRVGHDWSDLAAAAAHASKVILKILQARLHQYMNQELPDVQAGFREGRWTRDQTASACWIIEKAREFQKKPSTSVSSTMLKPVAVWITTNFGKLLKRWKHRTTLPASWEICMQVNRQQLKLDMKQLTGSQLGKAVYCHPAYLTYMQSTSCEMLGWADVKWSTSWNQDCREKYQ